LVVGKSAHNSREGENLSCHPSRQPLSLSVLCLKTLESGVLKGKSGQIDKTGGSGMFGMGRAMKSMEETKSIR